MFGFNCKLYTTILLYIVHLSVFFNALLIRHRGRRVPGMDRGPGQDERGPPRVDPRHDPLTYIGPERQGALPPSNLPIPVGIFMNMAHVPPRSVFKSDRAQMTGSYNFSHK